jgi:hypothetical protein
MVRQRGLKGDSVVEGIGQNVMKASQSQPNVGCVNNYKSFSQQKLPSLFTSQYYYIILYKTPYGVSKHED